MQNSFERWEQDRAEVFQIEIAKVSRARKLIWKVVKLAASVLTFAGLLALYTYLEVSR